MSFCSFPNFISNSARYAKTDNPVVLPASSASSASRPRPPADVNDDANQIIQEALKPSTLENNLRQLTDEIGGRVPGTPAMQRAVDWGVQCSKLRAPTAFIPRNSPSRIPGRKAPPR